jgi:large repetitive protein
MRLLPCFLALLALIGLPVAASAARPNLDVADSGRPARPVSTDRLRADAAAGRIGSSFHVDERYDLPTFLWAGRSAARVPSAGAGGRPDPEAAARDHLARHAHYYRMDDSDARDATLHHVHDTGQGGIIVAFQRVFDGIEVFRDELKVLLRRDLELVALSGFLPGKAMAGSPASRAFRSTATEAIGRALDDFTGASFDRGVLRPAGAADGGYEHYELAGQGRSFPAGLEDGQSIRTRKVFFHRPDRLEPAWYVEVTTGNEGLSYVISADDGTILFRRDLVQNDNFSYRVWADATLKAPMDGPQGNDPSPHPTGLPDNYDPGFVAPTLITLQNGPISTNDPWLAPGATQTSGNNVDAYADLVAADGFTAGDFRASTTSANTFDRVYDVTQGPGVTTNQRMASITQLFYDNNFLHDWFYDVGFNEVSRNAQTNNYGRGGLQNDNLRAEAQDYSGTNNANMLTPADGSRPRMQMYVFNLASAKVTLNSPGSIAGDRTVGTAAFGPQTYNVTGDVVLVDDGPGGSGVPTDACDPLVSSVAGKIALIDRGTCTFVSKIERAQNAGAIGVIIANNTTPGTITMGGTPTITITIPSQMVSYSDGVDIKHALLSGPVNATFSSQAALSRDGTIDNQIVAHEWGHYISNRLIGNAAGLNNTQGGGMGEGWGDFHALLQSVKAEDALVASNPNFSGVYNLGPYAAQNSLTPDNAYYFGAFRRYPYSTDFSKNPLTFRHIQNGVPLPVGPPVAYGADGANNAEVHNTGEVWCSMLWECYASLLRDTARLTFDQARDRMRAYLVAAYKLTPNSPTFVEAKEAVLTAALAADAADHKLFCAAFARRGAGVGAVAPPRASTTNIGVTESYAVCGGDLALNSATLDDAFVSCDADGVLDDPEVGTLTVTLRNTGTTALSATTARLSTTNPSLDFQDIVLTFPPSSASGTTSASTHVGSSGAVGIQAQDVQIQFDDPGLAFAGPRVADFLTRGNYDEQPSTTETAEAAVPTWTMSGSGPEPWLRSTVTALDHRFAATVPGAISDQVLVSPALSVGPGPFSFTFQHAHAFDASSSSFRDGGVIELSNDGGSNWTDIGASVSPGYGGTLTTVAGNPLGGRAAFVGQSPGYPAFATATASLGTTYAGQTVRVRFRLGTDRALPGSGWAIDNLVFSGITNTPFLDVVADPGPCVPVSVDSESRRALAFSVAGSNPAAGPVAFRFALPRQTRVRITLHDVAGRRVATLADGTYEAGTHLGVWNDAGRPGPGVYFARMVAEGREFSERIVVLSR